MKKRLVSMLFGLALLAVLTFAAQALAAPSGPTAGAGFSGQPLRNCAGLYCGELAKLPIGTQVNILVNDREGWAFVQVPSLGKEGWVCTHNIF